MQHSEDNAYIFCDQKLSPYEKTIYTLAMAYGSSPSFILEQKTINKLAERLNVDNILLNKALSESPDIQNDHINIQFGKEIIDCIEFYDRTFFDCIIKIHFSYEELDNIIDKETKDAVAKNIGAFEKIFHFLGIINSAAATYECMKIEHFSYDFTLLDSGPITPAQYLDMLECLVLNEYFIEDAGKNYDDPLISLISLLIQYELRVRLNAIYLILVTQIIKNSPFFDDEIHRMASEMYDHLMFILKNGRIISIQADSLFFDKSISIENRTRHDRTTRLQIIYGYNNYDVYVMRVDLSHQGQPFIHFNNSSPQKTRSNMFTKEEYNDAITRYPLLKSCFIEYSKNKWALKERENCKFTKETESMYDEIENEKAHKKVFSQDFSEETILEFIDYIHEMLPSSCYVPLDENGEYARRCFNYDILMRNAALLYYCYIYDDQESVNRLIDDMVTKAYRYGLISDEDRIKCNSLIYVPYILLLAKDAAKVSP